MWAVWHLKSLAIWQFVTAFTLTTMKTKVHITGSLWEESTSDEWIPLTKGQWCGKHAFIYCPILLSTHWGWVMHTSVGNLTITGSDNGLSPGRRQAIIWTNTGILLIGPIRTNFIEISMKVHTFSFKKMHLKISSGKWRPFCLGLNVWM